ncbi:glycoside hydrolase family 35 protein [Luteibacter yeojuensis]|uniref:Beta-galactosidase n=1 Tax=Luteibacter yeojuensis TaxID=345309 RepID=A0A7X5QRF4_9GAMM|nr:beta-galactosidase family protein [Luteibacter yeojuensis]NID13932.1 beta-galactosidase [Luteibacter yeojuensis]
MRHAALASLALAVAAALAAPATSANSPISVSGAHFMRDGKPYQIVSGDMHFQRVPRAYWTDRLRKARAMGLNTITTYVFWNLLEPKPGQFDFGGNNDVAAFVRAAQAEGLNVILRPGPYICGEWDAGGYPAWLFAVPGMRVRSRDPRFLAAADRYLQRLGRELAPLMASRGGPIVATELENEYGSYDNDRDYLEAIREELQNAGLADDLLLTYDGPDLLANGSLPGVTAVIDFAPGEAKKSFDLLERFRPRAPRMAGEYWAGWFDQWGGKHAKTDAKREADEIAWMLQQGYSVNVYLVHGGTSFGFMNGANYQGNPSDHYAPQTTSYDYDAALDEAGRPTAKYTLFRDAIAKATGRTPPPVPASTAVRTLPAFVLNESASLWDNLPSPRASDKPQPMEAYGQAYGYILYRTRVRGPFRGTLYLGDVRDYAAVYLDRRPSGTVDRRLKQVSTEVEFGPGGHTLDVLVENTGRVNYGPHMADGRAGIVDPVMLGQRVLHGWQVFPLPMTSTGALRGWTTATVEGPAFHRGIVAVDTPADTFLDTRAFGKGAAWLNGVNLGRIWSIGPQHDLYAPAPWFHRGKNTVVVFDFETRDAPAMQGVDRRLWSDPASTP